MRADSRRIHMGKAGMLPIQPLLIERRRHFQRSRSQFKICEVVPRVGHSGNDDIKRIGGGWSLWCGDGRTAKLRAEDEDEETDFKAVRRASTVVGVVGGLMV